MKALCELLTLAFGFAVLLALLVVFGELQSRLP